MASTSQPVADNLVSLRDVYGRLLAEWGAEEPRIVALDADLSTSTRTKEFAKKFSDRYLNVGIAEQNMVGVAAGVALSGDMPFVNTFAAFLTRRACDQITISVAYPRLNVKFFGFHGGINLGEDGATQQAVEDIGIMRSIPGIRVYVPIDAHELERAMREVVQVDGPTYLRLARFPSPILTNPASDTGHERLHDYQTLREGKDVLVITTGTIAASVLDAAEQLGQLGTQAEVIGVTRIKPLGAGIAELVRSYPSRPMAVVEEHNVHGGLADALSHLLDEEGVSHRIHRIGIEDRFGESGPPEALLEHMGIAGQALINRLQAMAQ